MGIFLGNIVGYRYLFFDLQGRLYLVRHYPTTAALTAVAPQQALLLKPDGARLHGALRNAELGRQSFLRERAVGRKQPQYSQLVQSAI